MLTLCKDGHREPSRFIFRMGTYKNLELIFMFMFWLRKFEKNLEHNLDFLSKLNSFMINFFRKFWRKCYQTWCCCRSRTAGPGHHYPHGWEAFRNRVKLNDFYFPWKSIKATQPKNLMLLNHSSEKRGLSSTNCSGKCFKICHTYLKRKPL